MHPRWIWLAAVLLLPACATTPQTRVNPPDKQEAAQRAYCEDWATQKADELYGPTNSLQATNIRLFYMLHEQERNRWFQRCLESRGYVITRQ